MSSLGPGYFPRARSRRIAKSKSQPQAHHGGEAGPERGHSHLGPGRVDLGIGHPGPAGSVPRVEDPGDVDVSVDQAGKHGPGREVVGDRLALPGGNRADGRAGDRDDDVAALTAETIEHAAGADGDRLAGAAAEHGGAEPRGEQ